MPTLPFPMLAPDDPRLAMTWAAVLVMTVGVAGLALMARAEGGVSFVAQDDSVTVFVTGCTLGSLRPCGCSGGQLGGLERRSAILNSIPSSRRLILDTGHWIKQDRQQDMIKSRILVRAFQLMDYDMVHLSDLDLQMALDLGILGEMVAAMGVITQGATLADVNLPGAFEKPFMVDGRRLSALVTAVDDKTLRSRLEGRWPTSPDEANGVDIYIIDKLDPSVMGISIGPGARPTCIIGPADSDEPRLWSDPNANPVVFSMGRYGRHVVRLRISVDATQARPKLQFTIQTVSEDLPNRAELVALYKDYQKIVAESGLLERNPRVPLPRDLEYVGSKACRQCHRYEYDKAITQRHARAYTTLQEAGSHLDPECVACHVVGLDHESGFVEVRETPELTDVGCEVCHGPGSEHVRTAGKAGTSAPQRACLDCHSPEHSREYAGHEQEFLEKIRHWKELRKASGVQQ